MAAGRAASYSSPSSSFNAGYGNSHSGAAASEDEDGQNLWSVSVISCCEVRGRAGIDNLWDPHTASLLLIH